MRRLAFIGLLGLVLSVFLGVEIQAQVPKEGSGSYVAGISVSFKVLPVEKERIQITYESLGVTISDDNQGLLHNASIRCIGTMHAIKGDFDDENGSCVYTLTEGDKVFVTYKASGKLGGVAKGTATIVLGTGKLVGIQGNIEFTRHNVRSATPDTSQSWMRLTLSYKVP